MSKSSYKISTSNRFESLDDYPESGTEKPKKNIILPEKTKKQQQQTTKIDVEPVPLRRATEGYHSKKDYKKKTTSQQGYTSKKVDTDKIQQHHITKRASEMKQTSQEDEQQSSSVDSKPRRSKNRFPRHVTRSDEMVRQRVFDRRSGTGRGKEMKKRGAGNHNWGTEISETKEVVHEQSDLNTIPPDIENSSDVDETDLEHVAQKDHDKTNDQQHLKNDFNVEKVETSKKIRQTRTRIPSYFDRSKPRSRGRGTGRKYTRESKPPQLEIVETPQRLMLDLSDPAAFPSL